MSYSLTPPSLFDAIKCFPPLQKQLGNQYVNTSKSIKGWKFQPIYLFTDDRKFNGSYKFVIDNMIVSSLVATNLSFKNIVYVLVSASSSDITDNIFATIKPISHYLCYLP